MARIKIGNIKGPKGDTGPRGATGPTGPQGPQGPLPPLTNNFLATVAGQSALDAAAGKVLKDQLDQQNSDLALCEYKTITYTSLFDSHGLSYSVRINKIVYAHLAFVTNSAVPANADICQLINAGSMEAITNIAYKSAKGTTGTFKVDSARAQNLRTDGNLVSGEAFVIDIILRIK